MTDKQLMFVEAYLGQARFNATAAARIAGYEDPEKEGWRVRQSEEVQVAIKERVSLYAMSAEEVLARLTEQATASMTDFVEADHWGGKPVIVFSDDTLKGKGHLIKRFTVSKGQVNIELHDAQAALVQLGKFHKLWVDKTETALEGELTIKVEYEDAVDAGSTDGGAVVQGNDAATDAAE
jgi:hypothetical protein